MTVDWSNEARHDVARLFDYNAFYSEDRAVLVDRRLDEAADLIERNPFIGRPIGGLAIRERSLADIQYVIRYWVGSERDITILRVCSTRESQERP